MGRIERGKLAELSIADLTVGIVVTPAENSLDVFTPGEETVSLEVGDQVGHSNGVVATSDRVKDAHFDEVLARGQLSLGLSTSPQQLHLLVHQSGEEGEHFVGDWSRSSEIWRVATGRGHVTQVRVGGWQHQLAKLVEIEHVVLSSVVFSDDVVSVGHARAQELFVHVVEDFAARELSIAVQIQVLEKFHWLEVGVTGQVLSSHLDLKGNEKS